MIPVEAYWAEFLGVSPAALRGGGIVVTEHARLGGYPGIWLFVRGESAVVSAPREWVASVADALGGLGAHQLLERELVVGRWKGAAPTVVGPSYQGWLPAAAFRPVPTDGVRVLLPSEAGLVERLRASCSAQDWESGGLGDEPSGAWGDFVDRELAALGRLRTRVAHVSDPCIVTEARRRRQGHGLRVASALVADAVQKGHLVLYQTLMTNAPALAVARRLGFRHYATLLALRLDAHAGRPMLADDPGSGRAPRSEVGAE